jgi:formate/nitrite transporter FocA (FNT family)
MKNNVKTLILSILAGISIGIAGVIFLSCQSPYLGALSFSVGLFFIVEKKFFLYTGLIGDALDNDLKKNLSLIIVLIGNFIGTFIVALLMNLTRESIDIFEKAVTITNIKLNDSWYSILILSFFCGILIYLGVDVYRHSQNNVSKVLAIILCVYTFIASGYEHCIANMFYISFSKLLSLHSVIYILIMVLGNSLGGLLIPSLKKLIKE